MNENIENYELGNIIQTNMGDNYSATVFDRAFPDIKDGLKSSHRKVLFALYLEGNYKPNGPTLKSASVIGRCLSYYAHGESSAYGALISLSQDFSTPYPIPDGYGNWGTHSSGGKSFASMRYTECKGSEFGYDILYKDFDEKIAEMIPTFTIGINEPIYFSTRIPYALLANHTGIGYGFATSIPPFNLNDVVRMCIDYILNPSISNKELVKDVYPDYPYGGIITNGDEVSQILENGTEGICKLRGVIEIDRENNLIRIKEFPYNSYYSKLKEELLNLAEKNNFHLSKISNIIDKKSSQYPGMYECFIYCMKDANLLEISNILTEKTSLKSFQSINFRLYDSRTKKIKLYNIKEIISTWYEIRFNYIHKEINLRKTELETRKHILEGLVKIYDYIDEIINIAKNSKDKEDCINNLLKFMPSLSKIQAKYISEAQIASLSRTSKDKLILDIESHKNKILECISELNRIPEIIIDQLKEIGKKYGRPRRTKVLKSENIQSKEILLKDKVLVYARNGLLLNNIDDFINNKNILNGLVNFIDHNKIKYKEIINYDFINKEPLGLLFIYSNGISNYLSKEKMKGFEINHWINMNINHDSYIKSIIPIYSEKDFLILLSSDKKLRKVKISEFMNNKLTCGLIDNVLYLENQFDGNILIINSKGEYSLLVENDLESEIPLVSRKATGVLTSFNENDINYMMKIYPDDKFLLLSYESENQGLINIIPIEKLLISHRTSKLKQIKSSSTDNNLNLLGISIIKQSYKNEEYNTILISKNMILKYPSKNLKNINEYKRINCKVIGSLQFQINK